MANLRKSEFLGRKWAAHGVNRKLGDGPFQRPGRGTCYMKWAPYLMSQSNHFTLFVPIFKFPGRGLLLACVCVCAQLLSCDPMDCSAPGSSLHGISQARILEWVAIFSSRGSFQPRDWICGSCGICTGRWILYHWATWEVRPPGLLLTICPFPLLEKRNLFFKIYFWLCCVFTATYWPSLVEVSSSYSRCGV